MYLSLEDKGSIFSILKNWPERRIKAICLTDGQRVGNLGDLGVQVGPPAGRLGRPQAAATRPGEGAGVGCSPESQLIWQAKPAHHVE